MPCPRGQGTRVVKNGRIPNGKPKRMCQGCQRQFVEPPAHHVIADATQTSIDRLLLERVSLAGMARVSGVSERRLQYYVKAC
jgi:insertion element IS1 protein InsB